MRWDGTVFSEKITSRQLFFLFFIMRTTIIISFLPVLTSAEALQDAWVAAVVAFFPSAAIIFVIGRLAVAFPGKSFIHYSRELLGGVLGGFISLFYLLLYLVIAATDLRIYGEVLKTGFLTETPLIVIMSVMIAASAMAVYSGLEPIGRCADLIFPVFFLMILGSLFFPVIHADFRNLQPVLVRGWSPVLTASITPVAITAQYASLVMIIPSLDEPRKALKAALLTIVTASAVLVFFAVMVVAVLGADEGARAAFPVFKMIRAARISEFLERVEALTIFSWGLGLFISLSIHLYSGSMGLAQLLGLKDNRPLLLPMSVIWGALAFQGYRDYFEIKNFFAPDVIAPFTFFILLFPSAVLWGAYFMKKPRLKKGRINEN